MVSHEPTTNHEPRWPAGTPIAPSGRGPGGGRWRAGTFGAAVGMAAGRLDEALQAGRRFQVRNVFGDWVDAVRFEDGGDGSRHLLVRDERRHTDEMRRDTYLAREKLGDAPATTDWAREVSSRMAPHQHTAGLMTHDQVASYLGRTDYTVTGAAGGAYGDVDFRQYSDGTKLAYKRIQPGRDTDTEVQNEVEASLIGRALGAPMPAVVPDPRDQRGMLMQYIDDDFGEVSLGEFEGRGLGDFGAWMRAHEAGEKAFTKSMKTTDGRLLGLLDLLIGNRDRSRQNVRLQAGGGVIGVDNGRALTVQSRFTAPDTWDGVIDHVAVMDQLPTNNYAGALIRSARPSRSEDLIQHWFSPAAIEEARRRLDPIWDELRPNTRRGLEIGFDILRQISTGTHSLD